jgi:eukaryotic-like serine/threonine-protein kinase
MTGSIRCEQCGNPLPLEGALQGKCPACLLRLGLQNPSRPEAHPGDGGSESHMVPGAQLGPYKIDALIGEGGMGQVYKARDTRLDRSVAIKIARERFSERFKREARAISALNHPNICTLYDVGPNYLVMELLEGETLAARLNKGPLALVLVLRYGAQIADTLAAAHLKGITHRDLKPGNIMVTKAGVKLLDFGLAKTAPAEGDAPPSSHAVRGTPAYMAPEQMEGGECDARTDIFALGLILYEMATSKRLAPGEPPMLERGPAQFAHVVERCLAKDPDDRWQSARDIKAELEWAAKNLVGLHTEAPAVRLPGRPWLAWSLVAVLVTALSTMSLLYFRDQAPTASEPVHFQIPSPSSLVDTRRVPVISPDGRKVAFSGLDANNRWSLWVHFLDSGESRLLAGTEGSSSTPLWSPDSRFIGFATEDKVKKIEASGGPALTVCDLPSPGDWSAGDWNGDGVIVFGSGRMFQVPAGGGVASPLTVLDASRREINHGAPSFLPDGRHFLYYRRFSSPDNNGIYLGSVDAKPEAQGSKRLLDTPFTSAYAPSPNLKVGSLLFLREGTLMAQSFDNRRMELTGEPHPVSEQVGTGAPGFGPVFFSVSANGVLAFRPAVELPKSQLTWFDRQGNPLGVVGELRSYNTLALSPDGTRVASDHWAGPGTQRDLWIYDLSRGVGARFTSDPGFEFMPVWSPDGSQVVFFSGPVPDFGDLHRKASSGAGNDEVLFKSNEAKWPQDWSPDGRFLLYSSPVANSGPVNLWLLPLTGAGGASIRPVPFLKTAFHEIQGRFSPDGHFIAYASDESGKLEVYVQPFPASLGGKFAGGKWVVSKGGGTQPTWRRDGKELFYISADSKMMAVEVSTSPTFKAGVPKALFAAPIFGGGAFGVVHRYDVTANGQRFLINAFSPGGAPSSSPPITVVLNWQAGLKN